MSLAKLRAAIKEGIVNNQSDQKAKNALIQLQTALNTLVRYEIIDENSISSLANNIEKTLGIYEKALKADGKSDIKGYRSRAKSLLNYYIELTTFNTENMTFSDVMKEGLKRKYGSLDIFYQGDINSDNHREVIKKYKTYKQAAMDIVKAGVKQSPKLWPSVNISNQNLTESAINRHVDAAAKNIRDWILGDTSPSSRIKNERLYFIEDYLSLPKGALVDKALSIRKPARNPRNAKMQADKSKKKKSNEQTSSKHKNFEIKVLNKNFEQYYEEYSNYKIKGVVPKTKNITQRMRNDKHAAKRMKVSELHKGEETYWTAGADGSMASAEKFYFSLRAFINFCVQHLKIPFEQVDVCHLTDTEILEELLLYTANGNIGASTTESILTILRASAIKRGYLRLCANPGNRILEDYFDDLDYITEELPNWIKKNQRNIKRQSGGSYSGKQNIQFLLDLEDADAIKDSCQKCSQIMIKKSQGSLLEADRLIALSNKKHNNHKKHMTTACSHITSAYYDSISAILLSFCFKNIPRCINLVTMKFYDSVNARDKDYASLIYHRQRNQYQLYIPLFGISPITGKHGRLIKNSRAKRTVPIDIFFHEELTPIFNNFINARSYYIKYKMTHNIPLVIEHNLRIIEEIENDHFETLTSKEKKDLKAVYELDNEALSNFDQDNIEALFPWTGKQKTILKKRDENGDIIDSIKGDKYAQGLLKSRSWNIKRLTGRKQYMEKTFFGTQLKLKTDNAFYEVNPNYDQNGINPQALRHLAAETHLIENPDDTAGAAAIINDTKAMVDETYGGQDRTRDMKRIANSN